MLKEGRERGSAPQQQTIRTITISIGSEVESEKDQRDCLIQHKRPSITAMRANLSEIDSGSGGTAHLSPPYNLMSLRPFDRQ